MTTGYTPAEVLAELRRAVEAAGGVRPFSRMHKVSAAYVSRTTRGEMLIGDKLAATLGLTPVVVFVARVKKPARREE